MALGDDNVQVPLEAEEQAQTLEEGTAASQPELWAELRGLVARAKSGDRTALPRLREFLSLNPCLWQRTGDVGLQAQAAWINLISGPNLHMRECTARRVNELKRQLAGNAPPSPVEALLIERLITAWLRVAYVESREAQHDEPSLRWAQFQMQRQAVAERQLRAAVDALETFRKASRPITVEVRQAAVPTLACPLNVNQSNLNNGRRKGKRSTAASGSCNGHSQRMGVNRINGNRLTDIMEGMAAGVDG